MSNTEAIADAGGRIDRATSAIRTMSEDLARELRPEPTLRGRLRSATRKAPLQALAAAFLLGLLVARRR